MHLNNTFYIIVFIFPTHRFKSYIDFYYWCSICRKVIFCKKYCKEIQKPLSRFSLLHWYSWINCISFPHFFFYSLSFLLLLLVICTFSFNSFNILFIQEDEVIRSLYLMMYPGNSTNIPANEIYALYSAGFTNKKGIVIVDNGLSVNLITKIAPFSAGGTLFVITSRKDLLLDSLISF